MAFTREFDTWVAPLAGGPEPRLRRRDAIAVARSGPRGVRVSLRGAGSAPRPVRVRGSG